MTKDEQFKGAMGIKGEERGYLSLEEYHALPWVKDWARWRVVDKRNAIWEFESQPKLEGNWLISGGKNYNYRPNRPIAFDWHNSLQQRVVEK